MNIYNQLMVILVSCTISLHAMNDTSSIASFAASILLAETAKPFQISEGKKIFMCHSLVKTQRNEKTGDIIVTRDILPFSYYEYRWQKNYKAEPHKGLSYEKAEGILDPDYNILAVKNNDLLERLALLKILSSVNKAWNELYQGIKCCILQYTYTLDRQVPTFFIYDVKEILDGTLEACDIFEPIEKQLNIYQKKVIFEFCFNVMANNNKNKLFGYKIKKKCRQLIKIIHCHLNNIEYIQSTNMAVVFDKHEEVRVVRYFWEDKNYNLASFRLMRLALMLQASKLVWRNKFITSKAKCMNDHLHVRYEQKKEEFIYKTKANIIHLFKTIVFLVRIKKGFYSNKEALGYMEVKFSDAAFLTCMQARSLAEGSQSSYLSFNENLNGNRRPEIF